MLCNRYRQILILALWGGAAIVAGSMLTSFHQPFTLPSDNIASLAPQPGWRVGDQSAHRQAGPAKR